MEPDDAQQHDNRVIYVGSAINFDSGSKWKQILRINHKDAKVKLDTGTNISIMSFSIYQQLAPDTPKKHFNARVAGVGNHNVAVSESCVLP